MPPVNPIYVPKGRAREYSPYALNLYLNCAHRCFYCYAQKLMGVSFFCDRPKPRWRIIEELTKQLENLDRAGTPITEQVMLSFIGDVYGPSEDNNRVTSEALKVLDRYDVPTAILTKNPDRIICDIDNIFGKGPYDIDIIRRMKHIAVGTTLTVWNEDLAKKFEPNAPSPDLREGCLRQIQDECPNVRTFISIEPILDQIEATYIIRKLSDDPHCNHTFKLGKLNGPLERSFPIDYELYLTRAIHNLRRGNKKFYVKVDLAKAAPHISKELTADERNADLHTVKRTVI